MAPRSTTARPTGAARRVAAKSSRSRAGKAETAATSLATQATADTPGSIVDGPPDRVTRPGDADTHAADATKPGTSEVAHAPASGTRRAEGGFPAGEYDVTKPDAAPADAAEESQHPVDVLLRAHFAAANTDMQAALAQARKAARLDDDERQAALESVPQGFVLEHEGVSRWRAHVRGQGRFGHGTTAAEAIESFILGNATATEVEAGARRFALLPSSVQQEIQERDAAATQGGQVDPVAFAREEALKVSAADRKARPAASNANSDGSERASARDTIVGGKTDPTAKSSASKSAKKASGAKKAGRSKAGRK